MERRHAEIAAKRAKLAELRAARDQRQQALSATPSRVGSNAPESSVDAILESVLGKDRKLATSHSSLSTPNFISGRTSQTSDLDRDDSASASGPASPSPLRTLPREGKETTSRTNFPSTLAPSSIELYDLPPRDKVTYDKSIQATEVISGTGTPTSTDNQVTNLANAGGAGRESAEEMRARIISELEEERKALDIAIAQETKRAAEEAEQVRRKGLDETTLGTILASPPFLNFLGHSTKVVERALSDGYDYLRDYTITSETEKEQKGQQVRLLGTWFDERWARGRCVTGVQWSPKYPELFVSSYNKNPLAVNDPDGLACVWNLHLLDRPEFMFHAQSDVLSVSFTPFHPNLLIGGTYSGQILLWDTRSKNPNPVLRTPLSSSGHTHPVYSLSMVGTQNAHNLMSASTDGTVCGWTLDMLAKPQETIDLVHPAHSKTDEVSVTAMGFPANETTTFWVGTEEGTVYSAHRYDRAGSKAGLVQNELYRGHSGPVTGIHFHPGEGPVDLSDLFLTCGVDWTVKLWKKGAGVASSKGVTVPPLMSFEQAGDYVFDVKWHPNHPGMFGTVDGTGKFDIWNLNQEIEVPVVSTLVAPNATRGLNKMAWEPSEGRRAAIGSSDGKVYVYEISQELVTPKSGAWEQVRSIVSSASKSEMIGR